MFRAILAIFIISTSCFSETFTLMGDDNNKLEVEQINGIKFVNFNKESMAFRALNKKELKLMPQKVLGDPASRFCKLTGGMSIILRDPKNRQYDFCKFKDGSMIDSWGLYEDR